MDSNELQPLSRM